MNYSAVSKRQFSLWGTRLAIVVELNISNWRSFLDSKLCFVTFARSDCKQCDMFETEIQESNNCDIIPMGRVLLDIPGLAEFKMEYPWISKIDILPFNAIFAKGEIIDSWSGRDIRVLEKRLSHIL